MRNNPSTTSLYEQYNPWVLLIISLGITMVGFQLIGAFFGLAIAFPFYQGDFQTFLAAMLDPAADEGMRVPLLIMQGVGSICGFILLPWILIKYFYRGSFASLAGKPTNPQQVVVAILITLFFMGLNAPFIEWNKNIVLPEALAGLETRLRMMEDTLARTSEFITHFTGVGELILGVIVVAIIPGIGEELVFRGLIQNHIYRISKNIHVAIWFGALLFSLFHMQFYGLVPRMFLGAMFGYMYYFSGSLFYPMIAHFFNNGFTLLMLYLYQNNIVSYNIEDTEVLPWPQIIFSAIVVFLMFYLFKRKADLQNLNEELG